MSDNKTTKRVDADPCETRQSRHLARYKAMGLVQVSAWIPDTAKAKERIKREALRLRSAAGINLTVVDKQRKKKAPARKIDAAEKRPDAKER